MKERMNTNTLLPEGKYLLTVQGCPEKRRTATGGTYRIWKFNAKSETIEQALSVLMFPQDSYDLLIALGGVDVGKKTVEWDDEEVHGKRVIAEVYHESGSDGKDREKIRNIELYTGKNPEPDGWS
jgi:hypothetical protein